MNRLTTGVVISVVIVANVVTCGLVIALHRGDDVRLQGDNVAVSLTELSGAIERLRQDC